MDDTTRNHLLARWEARLAKLPPEAQAAIRNAPPPTEAQQAALRAALGAGASAGRAAA